MRSPLLSVAVTFAVALPAAAADAPKAPPAPPAPAPAPVLRVTGFATPEGVLYDADSDRYLVSNINGKPLDKDDNGYISVVSPEGKVVTEKWLAGGKDGVKLNAPKGMALSNGVLYVADIDVVRTFDVKTGKSAGDIEIKGATFLNDMAAGDDGKVYVTDSGMKAGAKDFEGTGTDAVWVIDKKKAAPFFAAKDMGRPNGVFVRGKDVYVNFFGNNEVAKLDPKKGKLEVTKTPQGGGDGLYVAEDGTVWTASWGGSAVYKGKLGGTFETAIANVSAPADFAVDTKRKRLVLPRFMDNAVEIYELK